MKLHFQLWAAQTAEKTKIVLLHGMGGTGQLWRPIASGLENEFSILAPDQRGHGQSRPVEVGGYSPLEYGQDVVETLGDAGFFPAWIVGHSMGVRTACATAHLVPEKVRGLVLIDLNLSGGAGGGLSRNLSHLLEQLPESFESRQQARQFLTERSPDPSISQYLMAVSQRRDDGRITFPFERQALLETIAQAHSADLRGWLRELGQRGMPILLLRGGESKVWSREEFESERERFRDLPSMDFHEVPGTGHGLPFEKRELFVEMLRQLFLRD